MTITVKNTTTSPDNLFRYVYEYKGGDPVAANSSVSATSYTFAKPGKYRILQLGSIGGTGSIACQEIEVLDATPPNFRAYSCADLKVVLDIVNDAVASQYDEFLVDWNDGSAIQTVPKTALANISHNYLNNANYKIKVSGNYQGINCGGGSFQQVTPTLSSEFVKPVITRLATGGTTITLQIKAGAKQTVTLYQKNASGVFIPTTISRVGGGPLVIANITSHPTCFKAISVDACGQKFESSEVCSIGLEVSEKDQANQVIWTAPDNIDNFQKYTVTRNDAAFRTITTISNNSITDKDGLNCNQNYCYQVTAVAGPVEIISDRMCVTVHSSTVPPSFSTVQVSVNGDNRVDLRGLPPLSTTQNPSYKMIVFRRDQPGGSFAQTAEEIDRNIHQDGSVEPQKQSYCYEIVYQNACGVSSEHSKMVCTIYLNSNSGYTIDWTGDSPFADEKIDHYVIEKIDENGTVQKEDTVSASITTFRPTVNDPDTQRFQYRVKAVSKSGAISYSNFYTLLQAPRLFVPDAFTPNGDSDNNVLEVKGSNNFESIQLTVYNRWGEVVFHGENREGWDGKIDGQPAPIGTYAYRVVAQDLNGLRTEKLGKVVLLR